MKRIDLQRKIPENPELYNREGIIETIRVNGRYVPIINNFVEKNYNSKGEFIERNEKEGLFYPLV